MNPTSPLMILVDVNGLEIDRVPDSPLTPRAGESVCLQGMWYRVESVAYEVSGMFIEAVIARLSPI